MNDRFLEPPHQPTLPLLHPSPLNHTMYCHFQCPSGEPPFAPVKWYFAGSHFTDSCVLAFEMNRVELHGYPGFFFFEFMPITEPKLLSIFELDSDLITGCSVYWSSWISQTRAFPNAVHRLKPAIRLMQEGPVSPIRCVAARRGFWTLSTTFVAKFAKYLCIVDLDPALSQCSMIAAVCKSILKCTDEEAITCCHHRVICLTAATTCSHELAQCEAALQTFEQFDHDQVISDQQSSLSKRAERERFGKEFVERKAALRGGGAGGKSGACKAPKFKKYPGIPSTIPQAEAKRWLPPGCSIWRGVSKCNWNGHYAPYPRCSALWADHGEQGALLQVLRLLWSDYLEHNGMHVGDCPIAGLFGGGVCEAGTDAAAASTAASGSSSSSGPK